jgi:hypothetical protein
MRAPDSPAVVDFDLPWPPPGLEAWAAQILAIEDAHSKHLRRALNRLGRKTKQTSLWSRGLSAWEGHFSSSWMRRKLRSIDREAGVSPQDPRVYSIKAYLAEKRMLESARDAVLAARSTAPASRKRMLKESEENGRHTDRMENCFARHFQGVRYSKYAEHQEPSSNLKKRIDTVSKRWAYIIRHIETNDWIDDPRVWTHNADELRLLVKRVRLLCRTLRIAVDNYETPRGSHPAFQATRRDS